MNHDELFTPQGVDLRDPRWSAEEDNIPGYLLYLTDQVERMMLLEEFVWGDCSLDSKFFLTVTHASSLCAVITWEEYLQLFAILAERWRSGLRFYGEPDLEHESGATGWRAEQHPRPWHWRVVKLFGPSDTPNGADAGYHLFDKAGYERERQEMRTQVG